MLLLLKLGLEVFNIKLKIISSKMIGDKWLSSFFVLFAVVYNCEQSMYATM